MRRRSALVTVLLLCSLALPPMAQAQPRPQVFPLHSAEAGNVAGTVISTFGYPSVTVDNSIAAAWDGTLNYEANYPSIGFVAVQCVNQATNLVVTTTTGAASVRCNITGAQQFRARVSGRTVGTVTASAAIMSGGDSGVAAATITGTLVDDAAFGVATDRVFPVGYLFDDVVPDSVNEGDIGAPRMSANRVPYATLRDAAGNERGANVTAANALVVDGSAVTQPVSGTVTANQGTANATPWNNNTAQINGVTPLMGNGLTGPGSQRVTVASDNTAFTVNIGTFPDNEPFNVAQIAGTATVTAGVAGLQAVGGPAADGVAVSGHPVRIGGTDSGGLTQNIIATPGGRLINAPGAGVTPADATANAALQFYDRLDNQYYLGMLSHVFNGSTWDLTRSGIGPTGVGVQRVVLANNDPCQTSGIAKVSVVLNVTASAQVIAASGGTIIYVCGFNASLAGTTPTMQFQYGTGTVCATGLTNLSGAYAPTAGSMLSYGPGSTIFATTASQALCIATTGTGPSVQGVLTYVQQ